MALTEDDTTSVADIEATTMMSATLATSVAQPTSAPAFSGFLAPLNFVTTLISNVLSSGLNGLLGSAPGGSADTPLLWAVLAFARQQVGQFFAGSRTSNPMQNSLSLTENSLSLNSMALAALAAPPTPTAPPSVGTPNQVTGVVTGSLNVVDPENDPLTYTVSTSPTGGSVTVSAGGGFTYTPTQAARLRAGTTTQVDFDTFVVSVSDSTGSTSVSVNVPVLPAQLTSTANPTVGANPDGVAINKAGTRAYVVNQASRTVSVIDTATNTVVATINNVVANPTSVAVSPDNSRVYVGGYNGMSVINAATNAIVTTTATTGGQAYGIAVSPNGSRIYVSQFAGNSVVVLDAATNAVITTVAVKNNPRGVAVSPDGTRVYVANFNHSSVSVIDTATNTVVGSPITVGANPQAVAISPDGTRAYVTNAGSNSVSVINTATNTRITNIAAGSQPWGLAVSDNGTLYVANRDDTVSIIDAKTNTVVGSVLTDTAAENNIHSLAMSPDGRTLYITDMADRVLRAFNVTRGNTAPTVNGAPIVGTANPTTGVVTGSFNVTDYDGDSLSYTVTGAPTLGGLTINTSTGTFTYTPTATARQQAVTQPGLTDTFTVRIADALANTSVAVTVPIAQPSGTNQPPVATAQPSVGTPNAITGVVSGNLNVTDPDNNPLTYTVTGSPARGSVTVSAGTYTYTPTATARQQAITQPGLSDTFTVTVSDGQASINVSVTVPILPANRAPVATAQPSVGTPNATTGVVTGNLNVTDPDNNPLTYTVTGSPARGSVTVSAGTYTYTPTAAARQQAVTQPGLSDTFTVTVSDGQASINVSVTVPIAPATSNRPPAATALPTVGTPNQSTGVTTGSLNVADPDGNPLTYTVSTQPVAGTVTVNAAGSFTYTPTMAARLRASTTTQADIDSFIVTVSDGVASTTVSVNVAVLPAQLSSQSNTTVGTNPYGIAVNPRSDLPRVYVANQGSNTLSVVNTTNNSVVATINVVSAPTSVAVSPDGNRVYVGGTNAVSVIDAATNTVVATITTGAGAAYGIAVSPNGSRAYVTGLGNNKVVVINTTNNTVVTSLTTGGNMPGGVAVSPDSSRVYVANYAAGTVAVIDAATNTIIGTPITVGANPYGIAVGDNGRVYVANSGSGTVSVINTIANNTVSTITGVGTQPWGLALKDNFVYVATANDRITIIDTQTNTLVSTITQIDPAPEVNTHVIAVGPDGRIYVTDLADATLRSFVVTRGNTAPTVNGAPIVSAPSPTTGAVNGSFNVTDYDGDALNYTVTTSPVRGSLIINTTTGTYTYTPTAAARQQAITQPGLTDTFTVRIADTQAATASVTITVPILANNVQSTPYLPFDMPTGQTTRKVFAHYVPWLPLSPDNLPADQDYYTVNYLNPNGEFGAHAAYGGYMRDRPLPRDPINDPDWRYFDALTEVNQAKSVGIDGFTVDIVGPGYHTDTVNALYRAAGATPGFYIQPQADMSGPLASMTSADFAAAFVPLLTNPAAYRLSDGRVVLSAFAAEGQTATWWNNTLTIFRENYGLDVAFVPTFLNASANLDAFAPFSYGFGNWGARNPAYTNPNLTGPGSQVDLVRRAHALGKIWMQPVAFQDNRPRNGLYEEAGNSTTLSNSWQIAINEGAEWVQLVTWNDYAETTSMAPSVEHGYRLLDMQAYQLAQFKYGYSPTIVRDAIYVNHRQQFAASESTYDETLPMTLWPGSPTQPTDNVEVVVYATAPATIYATIGGVTSSCAVGAGRSTCTFPLREGTVEVTMVRNGVTQQTVVSPYTVTNTPYIQDLQYNVAGGLR